MHTILHLTGVTFHVRPLGHTAVLLFVGIFSLFVTSPSDMHLMQALGRASVHAHGWSDKNKKNPYKYRERGAFTGTEGSIKIYKFLLSLQSHQGVAQHSISDNFLFLTHGWFNNNSSDSKNSHFGRLVFSILCALVSPPDPFAHLNNVWALLYFCFDLQTFAASTLKGNMILDIL